MTDEDDKNVRCPFCRNEMEQAGLDSDLLDCRKDDCPLYNCSLWKSQIKKMEQFMFKKPTYIIKKEKEEQDKMIKKIRQETAYDIIQKLEKLAEFDIILETMPLNAKDMSIAELQYTLCDEVCCGLPALWWVKELTSELLRREKIMKNDLDFFNKEQEDGTDRYIEEYFIERKNLRTILDELYNEYIMR